MSEALQAYRLVDDIPEVGELRLQARTDAWNLVEQRRELQHAGDIAGIPLTIDALSTAEKVIEINQHLSEESVAYQKRLAGLQLDTLRLVAEWHRKLRPEYFEPVRHKYDPSGDFYSHGLSIRQMTENALTPISDNPEEIARRVNERVEDATPHILRKVGGFALGQVGIRTISQCTDKAIKDYQHDIDTGAPHDGYGGYVPEIEKVMIRDMRFDEETGDRLEEQIGLPGTTITHFVIQEALRRRGVETKGMGKTEIHGAQLLVKDDLLDFVQLLDQVASEEWCVPIFMGERVDSDHPKNYIAIRSEAHERQQGLKDLADTTAQFVLDLARDGYDKRKAPAKVEAFVKKQLLNLAKQDLSLAPQMFDEKTRDGLAEVIRLESLGRYQEAFDQFEAVEKAAPGGGYCGAGSCGLENVNLFTTEGRALREKLKVEEGDTVVRDTERACSCGEKKIVYAYNKNKVNKYCEGCGAFESNQTTTQAKVA